MRRVFVAALMMLVASEASANTIYNYTGNSSLHLSVSITFNSDVTPTTSGIFSSDTAFTGTIMAGGFSLPAGGSLTLVNGAITSWEIGAAVVLHPLNAHENSIFLYTVSPFQGTGGFSIPAGKCFLYGATTGCDELITNHGWHGSLIGPNEVDTLVINNPGTWSTTAPVPLPESGTGVAGLILTFGGLLFWGWRRKTLPL